MADLTKVLKQNEVADRINTYYEKNYKPRTYLGLSQSGHECDRFLWYKHNGYVETTPDGRVLRLFKLGNSIEGLIVNDLRNAGYVVTEDQKEVVFDLDSVSLNGHIDGLIEGVTDKTHLLEIKSAYLKQFNILKKKGYEEWHGTYKFQIQAYMLGLNLTRCLAVVYCKNNSELYTERIYLNKDWIIRRLEHVFGVVSSDVIPDRKCPNQSWWKAKFCGFKDICFGGNT